MPAERAEAAPESQVPIWQQFPEVEADVRAERKPASVPVNEPVESAVPRASAGTCRYGRRLRPTRPCVALRPRGLRAAARTGEALHAARGLGPRAGRDAPRARAQPAADSGRAASASRPSAASPSIADEPLEIIETRKDAPPAP